MKYLLHKITFSPLCAPTSSPNVELFIFNLCFRDKLMTYPFQGSSWRLYIPLQSLCVLCWVSIQHFTADKHSAINVSFMCLVPFKSFKNILIFPQSYSYGSLTLEVKNETSVCISLLDILIINNNCTTKWWNIYSHYSSKISDSSSTFIWNRWYAAGVVDVPINSSKNLHGFFCKYLIIETFTIPGSE